MAKLAQTARWADPMKFMAAGKAKNGFGLLIDTARAEPVTIEKHGRPVAVVLSVEEYERLKASGADAGGSVGGPRQGGHKPHVVTPSVRSQKRPDKLGN
jgi:prevent-host-death family protein